MDLNSFLADTNTGASWADEMDELPTGPSAGPAFGDSGALGGSHLTRNMGMRGGPDGPGGFGASRYGDDRPQRAEVPIPTEPPYTAFVGNLSFETTEADLEDFFGGLGVKSVRLVDGQDGKPRGFGYVEFATVDDLKQALTATGTDLQGRAIRLGVAEARDARFGRADEASTWERTGPLAPIAGRSGGFGAPRSGGFGDRPPRGEFEEVEREGPIRGGKFTPSAPSERRDRGPGFGGYERAGPPGGGGGMGGGARAPYEEVEREGPIRGGKFAPSEPPREQRRMFSDREPSRADEGSWERRGPPPARSGPGAGGDAPVRQRLQLSARSAASPAAAAAASSGAEPSSRASPFGAARPVDVSSREREVEAKLASARAAAPPKEERAPREDKKDKAEEPSRADQGSWVRRGPLAPAAAKPKEVAPPIAGGAGAAEKKRKDEKFSFASAAGVDGVEEVTEGVKEL
ncbi:Eukaryotic translation initiation factor 4B [Rhodotorula kratochvilovae]